MRPELLKTLRAFFISSNAAFEVAGIFGTNTKTGAMQDLHKQALLELKKEAPNEAVVYALLTQMEVVAATPLPPNFPEGGPSIVGENGPEIIRKRDGESVLANLAAREILKDVSEQELIKLEFPKAPKL